MVRRIQLINEARENKEAIDAIAKANSYGFSFDLGHRSGSHYKYEGKVTGMGNVTEFTFSLYKVSSAAGLSTWKIKATPKLIDFDDLLLQLSMEIKFDIPVEQKVKVEVPKKGGLAVKQEKGQKPVETQSQIEDVAAEPNTEEPFAITPPEPGEEITDSVVKAGKKYKMKDGRQLSVEFISVMGVGFVDENGENGGMPLSQFKQSIVTEVNESYFIGRRLKLFKY